MNKIVIRTKFNLSYFPDMVGKIMREEEPLPKFIQVEDTDIEGYYSLEIVTPPKESLASYPKILKIVLSDHPTEKCSQFFEVPKSLLRHSMLVAGDMDRFHKSRDTIYLNYPESFKDRVLGVLKNFNYVEKQKNGTGSN